MLWENCPQKVSPKIKLFLFGCNTVSFIIYLTIKLKFRRAAIMNETNFFMSSIIAFKMLYFICSKFQFEIAYCKFKPSFRTSCLNLILTPNRFVSVHISLFSEFCLYC